jgi:hypothetical protein
MSVGAGCVHHGIVIHELLHALGLWHEQSRSRVAEHLQYATSVAN